jgi:hypothetical protein
LKLAPSIESKRLQIVDCARKECALGVAQAFTVPEPLVWSSHPTTIPTINSLDLELRIVPMIAEVLSHFANPTLYLIVHLPPHAVIGMIGTMPLQIVEALKVGPGMIGTPRTHLAVEGQDHHLARMRAGISADVRPAQHLPEVARRQLARLLTHPRFFEVEAKQTDLPKAFPFSYH